MPQVLATVVVWSDGNSAGSGLARVDHVGSGKYYIWFDMDISNSIQIASLAEANVAGWITAYGEPGVGQNEVTVETGDFQIKGEIAGGNPPVVVGVPFATHRDLTFQLIVVR